MAIQIYCTKCRSSVAIDSKICPFCGMIFGREKKYRVCVSVKGKRVNRMVDNLTIARETEAAIKGDLVRAEYDISHHRVNLSPKLNDLLEQYLIWAKHNKKTWKCDEYNYRAHLEPRFGKMRLDSITGPDIERMKTELKEGKNIHGRPFTEATIKHQIVLMNRLYNLAKLWKIYLGENPVASVKMPRLDNQKPGWPLENPPLVAGSKSPTL